MSNELIKKLINTHKTLTLLSKCNKKIRNKLIKNSKKDFIFSLCECLLNILNGNIKITEDDKKKLKEKKYIIKKLIKKSSLSNKKKIIQSGGFLEILIPSLISGLASIITSAINNQE